MENQDILARSDMAISLAGLISITRKLKNKLLQWFSGWSQSEVLFEEMSTVEAEPVLFGETQALQTGDPRLFDETPDLQEEQAVLFTEKPDLQAEQAVLLDEKPDLQAEQPTVLNETQAVEEEQLKGEIPMKEDLKSIAEIMGQVPCGDRDCCCPLIPVFIFKHVNCVNIFNGACNTWNPASPCAPGVYNSNA